MSRLLIVSHDVVGSRMAGPGIRYWELARALAACHQVTLIAPRPIDLADPALATGSYAWGQAATLAPWLAQAEVILANGYLLEAHPEIAATDRPLILDLYDPTLLENLELLRDAPLAERMARTRRDIELLGRQLAAGDFFLCATERQRDLYIGALMAAGRIDPSTVEHDPLLRGLIDLVPFGLPGEPAARSGPALRGVLPGIDADTQLILWSGGLWDWMDPQTLVRAMPAVVARCPLARLVFLAGRHPGLDLQPNAAQQARRLAAELGLLDRSIFFYEQWVPYARRADFLLEADVVVSLHRQHLETAYAAVRSRVLDYFWVGLPGVLSEGDPAAELLRTGGAGLVTPIGDADAVAGALIDLLADSERRAELGRRAAALADRFAWPNLITPILTFIAAAHPPTRRSARMSATMPNLEAQPAPMTSPEQPPNAALLERERLIGAARNAAIQAQEQTWRISERPIAGGRFARLRRLIIDQFVRPFVFPLFEQQQQQNVANLRAFYAFAEQVDLLAVRIDQLRGEIERLQLRVHNIESGMQQMNHWQLSQVHQIAQQIRDFAVQLEGLEETNGQILAHLGGIAAAPPVQRAREHE